MANGDIYYLIDSQGLIRAKFEQTDDYMTGNLYSCVGWSEDEASSSVPYEWEYVAEVFCKSDACTHWWFYGENYNAERKEKFDSYYHLCEPLFFMHHIRCMCFVWKLAPMIIAEDSFFNKYTDDINRDYFDSEEIKQLVETMLKGYEIKKVERSDA